MANYRPVHVKIWDDPKFQELEPLSKLVFLYLFTNQKITESGVYPCTFRTISNDTNIPLEEIEVIVLNCLSCMVLYDSENHVVWVKNFLKYNHMRSRPDYLYKSVVKDMNNTTTSLWEPFSKAYECLLEVMQKPRT